MPDCGTGDAERIRDFAFLVADFETGAEGRGRGGGGEDPSKVVQPVK